MKDHCFRVLKHLPNILSSDDQENIWYFFHSGLSLSKFVQMLMQIGLCICIEKAFHCIMRISVGKTCLNRSILEVLRWREKVGIYTRRLNPWQYIQHPKYVIYIWYIQHLYKQTYPWQFLPIHPAGNEVRRSKTCLWALQVHSQDWW